MLPIFVIAALLGIANAYLPASIEEFPHQVYVQVRKMERILNYGNGAIISPNWVVTQVNDFFISNSRGQTVIRAGADVPYQGTIHEVDKIIVHEDFDKGAISILPKNNIALVHVKNPFKYDESHKAVELFGVNETVKLGYALVTSSSNGYSHLAVANVSLIDYEICDKAYKSAGYDNGVPKGSLCSEPKRIRWPMNGDEGAPLIQAGRMAGFYSYFWFYLDDLPILYTEIAYYRDWIKRHTGV